MDIKQENEDLIAKCRLLPPINTIEDCRKFYKIFFTQKLYDINYGEKDHEDYRNKPIEKLTLNEVLTSFTVIQRENYWEDGSDYIFEEYLKTKMFQELCL